MTLDPGQPTKAVDLQHVDAFLLGSAVFLAVVLTLITLGWSDALALAMAAGILACRPNPLEPR